MSPRNRAIDHLVRKERGGRRRGTLSPSDRMAEILDDVEPPPVTVQIAPYGGVPRRTMRKPRRVAGGVLGALWKLLKSSLH